MISVIGIGFRPLGRRARESILRADAIVTSPRLLEVFQRYDEYEACRERVKVIDSVDGTVDFIRKNRENLYIALLAAGDPLFFGIGSRVIEEFGKDSVELFPDLSSIQAAFSLIKRSWEDALLISLHRGPDPGKRRAMKFGIGDIPGLTERFSTIAILTDEENSPAAVARKLISSLTAESLGSLMISVCERLGYDNEKITRGHPEEIAAGKFLTPNIMIVERGTGEGSCKPVIPCSE